MMTPEQIAYVREWAKSGNEWRRMPPLSDALLQQMSDVDPSASDFYRLNSASLTIARLADALEQACDTAELMAMWPSTLTPTEDRDLETMRANRKELLG